MKNAEPSSIYHRRCDNFDWAEVPSSEKKIGQVENYSYFEQEVFLMKVEIEVSHVLLLKKH